MATLVRVDSPLPETPARTPCSVPAAAQGVDQRAWRALMSPMLRLSDTTMRHAGQRRCTPQTSCGVSSSCATQSACKGKTYE